MFYPIYEGTINNAVVNIQEKLEKVKFTHLSIQIHGVAIKATEAPKMIVNAWTQDNQANIRKRITNVPMNQFGEFQDMSGGIGFISTTDLHALIPLGLIDCREQNFYLEIKAAALAANDCVISIYAVMLADEMEQYEYIYKAVSTDGYNINKALAVYDVSTAYNSAVKTVITMDNGSQMTIPHKQAFSVMQASARLETANGWGVIYSDKTMEGGRDIRIEPDTAFNAFIIQYGLNN